MAITLNCWESADSGGDAISSLTISKPTSGSASGDSPKNAAVGDLLVIIVGNDDAENDPQWDDSTYKPTGFTLIREAGASTNDSHCAAFYKVVDGTEGASFDVPSLDAQNYWGSCILLSGAAGIHGVTAAQASEAGSPTTFAITGLTCTEADCLAFYVCSYDGGDDGGFSVAGTGWSERAEVRDGTGSGNASGCWGTRQMSGTGDTGTATITVVVGDGMYGFQFAIEPSSEAAAVSNDLYMTFEA